ncbi:MAG: hypothetical protein WDN08_19955 [Rhizomicrobium sp.]
MDEGKESAEEAAGLDRLLAHAEMPVVPAALGRRILADFDRVHTGRTWANAWRRAAEAVWPGAPLWQPVAAFGLALLIGAGVAVFAPLDIPQQDDAGAHVFALDAAPDTDAGKGI